jgi:hypothetical protein
MAKIRYALADEGTIKALIGSIGKSATALNSKIHLAAVHCIGHAIAHGDVRLATELYDACSKGVRRQSLVAFLEKHGPFAWQERDKKFAFYKGEREFTFDGDMLMSLSWLEAQPERVISTLDVEDMVAKLLKRVQQAVEKDPTSVKNMDLFTALNNAVVDYHNAKAQDEVELPLPKAA